MTQGKTLIMVLVTLVIGFAGGFVLRPLIMPQGQATVAGSPAPAVASPAAARGTQYFAANLDDARRIVAGCKDGSVRGDECANAEAAVVEAEGRDRFKTFTGN
ncbi:hypothetical protein [Sphingomonas sp.]|uniref:hypothetical protein n=1 Tax=Sphingomonas sp. TaxID=28214 RepID=UPI0025F61026|nr:hypothetical protein [Sphingomonas sp.]